MEAWAIGPRPKGQSRRERQGLLLLLTSRGKSQTELPKGAAKIRWKDPRSSSGKPGALLSLMQSRFTDLLRLHSLVPSCHKAALPNVRLGSGGSVGSGYWSVQLQSMPDLN